MESMSHHITPLVVDSLGGGHTHTRAQKYMHTDIHGQSNSKKPGTCCGQHAPGLKRQPNDKQ